MEIQPYLFFQGRCDEAIEFYKQALDAQVDMIKRYEESPEPPPPGMLPPGSEKKVMHSSFRIGGAVVMASDGECSGEPGFGGFRLSITVPDAATADRFFDALAEGGTVQMPMGKTFWTERFGMVTDRFGVGWMIGLPMEE